jgi:hypothetical protein
LPLTPQRRLAHPSMGSNSSFSFIMQCIPQSDAWLCLGASSSALV